MILKDIDTQLKRLYCTGEHDDYLSIGTWFTIEGDPINLRYVQEDHKISRITTNSNFTEWIAWHTDGWRKASPLIEELVGPYGVQWDQDNGILFIRFHRNEMTIAQAILRLMQAVYIVGAVEF